MCKRRDCRLGRPEGAQIRGEGGEVLRFELAPPGDPGGRRCGGRRRGAHSAWEMIGPREHEGVQSQRERGEREPGGAEPGESELEP
ncbi:MAG: hypothetical protein PHC88_12390 [Terrimicrobiaceae bacterium]|nr:hypothetical protein [Terrimicrobiaceae bacterium]